VRRLVVTANVLSAPILVNLMMQALRSYETLFLTSATWHTILEDGILHQVICSHNSTTHPAAPICKNATSKHRALKLEVVLTYHITD
jgi:hypothetical protein